MSKITCRIKIIDIMKHILTILVMMMALGCYAFEPFSQDTIPSQQMADTTRHARNHG